MPPLTGGIYSQRRGRYELWHRGRLIAYLDAISYFSMGEEGLRQWRRHYWRKYFEGGAAVTDRIPDLTRQPIEHVDGTPDRDYSLRILRAYRANCDCKFEAQPPSPLITMMNEHQDERAALLDKAIAILEEHLPQ